MILLLKGITLLFVLAGAAFAFYGGRKIREAMREEQDRGDEEDGPRRRYYVLPARYLAILGTGLGFVIIPLLVYGVGVRALASPAGIEMTEQMEAMFAEVLELRVGPLTVLHLFYGFGVFFAFVILVSIIAKIFRR